jgi:serine/threonine-protein kinase RsbW
VVDRLAFAPDLESLKPVREFVEAHAKEAGLPDGAAKDLVLAVDEALTNIIDHGGAPADGLIEVDVPRSADGCVVRIRDNGRAFDPTAVPDEPPPDSPLDREAPGGFGLFLIKHLVDDVRYATTVDGRNELTLLKRRHAASGQPAGSR